MGATIFVLPEDIVEVKPKMVGLRVCVWVCIGGGGGGDGRD